MIPEAAKVAEDLKWLYDSLDPLDKGNVSGLIDQLDYANQWLVRCSTLLADAQAINDLARSKASEKYGEDTTPTRLNIALNGDCAEERKLLLLAERLSALLVHRIDSIRTLISLEKQMAGNELRGR